MIAIPIFYEMKYLINAKFSVKCMSQNTLPCFIQLYFSFFKLAQMGDFTLRVT